MFCTKCGSEIEQHARFCSKCGSEATSAAASPVATPPAQPKRAEHDMAMHINILGWLLVGSAILTAIGGIIVLFASQIIQHLPGDVARQMPPGIPHFVMWITSVVGLAIIALASGIAAAGVGLLQYKSWARVLAIIMAVLLVFHFPIGTVIAIYAFWVLFSDEGQQYYKSRSESTMTASGT
jgi:zinc-ribbon domain